MGNDMTTTTRTPFGAVTVKGGEDAIRARMQQAANTGAIGMAPDGSEYLNFSGKRGVYEFGKDKADIDNDEIWVVNSMSFEDGWVCWKGGSKVANRMASIFSDTPIPDPNFDEHGPFDPKTSDGWSRSKAMVIRSVDEDDRQGYYSTNSKTGVGAIAGLQQEIVERMNSGAPAWPLIQLDREEFKAQNQKNWKPILRVYGWLTYEALCYLGEDPDADIDDLIRQSSDGTFGNGNEEDLPDATVQEPPAPEPVEEKTATTTAPSRRRRPAI